LVHPFEKIFELIEPTAPETGHPAGPVDQWGKSAKFGTIVGLAAFVPAAYQPGLLQNSKVL